MERMGALVLVALAGLLMVAYRLSFWAARGWAVDGARTAEVRRWRAARRWRAGRGTVGEEWRW